MDINEDKKIAECFRSLVSAYFRAGIQDRPTLFDLKDMNVLDLIKQIGPKDIRFIYEENI